jgi:hypothetical protein
VPIAGCNTLCQGAAGGAALLSSSCSSERRLRLLAFMDIDAEIAEVMGGGIERFRPFSADHECPLHGPKKNLESLYVSALRDSGAT